MEGLIPYVLRAMKKQKLHRSFRSMSMDSSRSYHLLTGSGQDSLEGLSYRRARSEFQPPTVEILEQRRFDKGSFNYPSMAGGSNMISSSYPQQQLSQPSYNIAPTLRHRRH